MDRINGADTVDIGNGRRGFRDENAQAGTVGTEVTDAWLNGLQEEVLGVVEEYLEEDPDANDWTQLRRAIAQAIEDNLRPFHTTEQFLAQEEGRISQAADIHDLVESLINQALGDGDDPDIPTFQLPGRLGAEGEEQADLNNATENGFYWWWNGLANANGHGLPAGVWAVHVLRDGNNRIVQRAHQTNIASNNPADINVMIRGRSSGSADDWSQWFNIGPDHLNGVHADNYARTDLNNERFFSNFVDVGLAGEGTSHLHGGGAGNAGYLGIVNQSGVRKGYMGWGQPNDPILYRAENGSPGHDFNGTVTVQSREVASYGTAQTTPQNADIFAIRRSNGAHHHLRFDNLKNALGGGALGINEVGSRLVVAVSHFSASTTGATASGSELRYVGTNVTLAVLQFGTPFGALPQLTGQWRVIASWPAGSSVRLLYAEKISEV